MKKISLSVSTFSFPGVSAGKSAGVVGRFGSTSFTSIRTARENSAAANGANATAAVAKPKKFFKSRNKDPVVVEEDLFANPVVTPIVTPTSVTSAKRPKDEEAMVESRYSKR